MSRYFASISIGELQRKIEDAGFNHDHSALRDKLGADLKVDFDFENWETNGGQRNVLMGYTTLSNGMTFLGMEAGGDWEYPVFFIIYWDGKKLRGYVPMEGNPWNTTTKQAYGNDEDADGKNAHKRWPDKFDGSPLDDSGCFDTDEKAIEADIKARILPQPAGLKPTVRKTIYKKPKSLQERVEALVYYGDCDEGTELFQQTLSLCYNMSGLGQNEQAETLYQWAKDMAEASKEDAEQYGETNTIKGYWGH